MASARHVRKTLRPEMNSRHTRRINISCGSCSQHLIAQPGQDEWPGLPYRAAKWMINCFSWKIQDCFWMEMWGLKFWTMQFLGSDRHYKKHVHDCYFWHWKPHALNKKTQRLSALSRNAHLARITWEKNIVVPSAILMQSYLSSLKHDGCVVFWSSDALGHNFVVSLHAT